MQRICKKEICSDDACVHALFGLFLAWVYHNKMCTRIILPLFDPYNNAKAWWKGNKEWWWLFPCFVWVVDRMGYNNKVYKILFIPCYDPQKNAQLLWKVSK